MFKFILRFIADIILALIITLVIMFGTKSNLTIITADEPKHDYYIQTPNVTETEVIAADMTDNIEEVVSEEEISE